MTNIVMLHPAKKTKQLPGHRPCSFKAISDKGNRVYGIAAFLVLSKRAGGVDAFMGECVQHTIAEMSKRYGT